MKAQLGVLCLTHKEEKNCERLTQLDTLIKIHMDPSRLAGGNSDE